MKQDVAVKNGFLNLPLIGDPLAFLLPIAISQRLYLDTGLTERARDRVHAEAAI